jgi:hypothetical protein
LLLTEKERRPQNWPAIFKELLRGYPFAIGIASTFTLMLILMPVMKLQDLFKRCHSEHIPVMIKPEDYRKVVAEVRDLLESEGYEVIHARTTWMLALPTKVLSSFAKTSINVFVANELATLKWNKCEIIIHPCDLVVRGSRLEVTRMQAWIIQNLALRSAYFTWHKEAHSIEDQLRHLRIHSTQNVDRAGLTRLTACLKSIDERLCQLSLPAEEWNVLYRELLQVKCRVFEMNQASELPRKS